MVRNYLDWMLSIPWGTKSRVKKDLGRAERILNEDHYSLDKVKERIVEYLAVQQRSSKLRGPIMCLVGRPVWVKHPGNPWPKQLGVSLSVFP